jgi:PAS domain S-box-containing protein
MTMHQMLQRQLKRAGLTVAAPPADAKTWQSLLEWVDRAYTEADQDRYLMERSLSLSSNEMRGLHQQLAAERDTLHTVICALAEGLCALDGNGCVLFLNPEAQRMLGLEGRTVLGEPLTSLVNLQDDGGARIERFRASKDETESRVVVANDRSTYLVYSASALAEPQQGVVVTLRDITERRRIEAEREELHRRLVETSRHAGMAEVASGVLHNVGNVLNSVNVSAAMAADHLKRSRLPGLTKAADLLKEHVTDAGEFFADGQPGRKLPAYLDQLATQLRTEQETVLSELASLTKNIEHIKEIVATQQTYAKVSGVREIESLPDLIEDAIRVNAASLGRHRTTIVREFSPVPKVLIEKNQILQILINLISNAKSAVASLPVDERRVRIRLEHADEVIRIQVIDSGMGIAPENLTRIFSHGFTTRKDGHGFGLHSAALAAKALGGTLAVASDGPGRGARFTLELPAGQEVLHG